MNKQVSFESANRRLVLLLWPKGREQNIRRSEAEEMLKDGSASYGGRRLDQYGVERECLIYKAGAAMIWRKTTRTAMGGAKLGMSGMELVHL